MTSKPVPDSTPKQTKSTHPGMRGDGTEEQNWNDAGDPSLRIKKDEVAEAVQKRDPKKR